MREDLEQGQRALARLPGAISEDGDVLHEIMELSEALRGLETQIMDAEIQAGGRVDA